MTNAINTNAVTDKVIDRINKMLALANCAGATEGERDNALRMSYNLLAKYNLTMVDVDAAAQEKEDPRKATSSPGWSQTWAKHIYNSMADLFFCSYFSSGKINATKCHHYIVGKESNATTARLMAEYIINSILKEARSLYVHNLAPESRAFAVGAMTKLSQRVKDLKRQQAQDEQQTAPGNALVLANLYDSEKRANQIIVDSQFNVKTKHTTTKSVNADAYQAGKDFGAKVSLAPQVGANRSRVAIGA